MANEIIPSDRYSYCVSLGWFCGTARALRKNGLRFFSGPFDWYLSDFPPVLSMIENSFDNFLNKDNLQVDDKYPKEFQDIKYGFSYKHDVKEDFEKEYCLIVEKYKRRIDKFLSAIKEPTCFFRAVRSESEIQYIIDNKDYIDKIIKQSNSKNVIVYLLLKGMSAPKNEIYFYLNTDRYVGKSYEMLTMLDGSEDLLNYCAQLIDGQQKKANLDYFKKYSISQNEKAALLLHDISINEKLNRVLSEKELYVWGAGLYGVEIEKIFHEAGIKILGFLDNSEEKNGTYINNIKVSKFEDVENISTIFIDIASSDISERISDQIHLRNSDIEIYTWSSIWNLFPAL